MKGCAQSLAVATFVFFGTFISISCKSESTENENGVQDDGLVSQDTRALTDVQLTSTDATPILPDAGATDGVAPGSDSTEIRETSVAIDVPAADAQDAGDDGCPIWMPVDEPDYGKPPQPPSSQALCTPELPCVDGEMCAIDFYLVEGVEHGPCFRVCYHPESDFPSDLGCDPSEFCALTRRCISQNIEPDCDVETGRGMQGIGWCVPKNRTLGGLGGNWDASGCPCEHPTLSEEDKAACEAGAN